MVSYYIRYKNFCKWPKHGFPICLLFWCSNIVVFSVRIFCNSIVGHECFFKLLCYGTCIRRLTMCLSDTSSIAQHLKKHSCPTTELEKILTENTTILEYQNNKQKLHILEALHIRNIQPKLNRINLETSANVLKCLKLLTLFIETNSKSKRYTIQQYTRSSSYKVAMYVQKLHPFFYTSSPDDGPKSARSTWEITNYRRFINQYQPNIIRSIQQFDKINKKICRQKMSIIFNQICINAEMLPIYIYIYIYIYMTTWKIFVKKCLFFYRTCFAILPCIFNGKYERNICFYVMLLVKNDTHYAPGLHRNTDKHYFDLKGERLLNMPNKKNH